MLQASTPWPVAISSPKAAMRSRHSSTLTAPASSAAIARMRSSAACWRTISAYSRQLALVGVISISWISRSSMPWPSLSRIVTGSTGRPSSISARAAWKILRLSGLQMSEAFTAARMGDTVVSSISIAPMTAFSAVRRPARLFSAATAIRTPPLRRRQARHGRPARPRRATALRSATWPREECRCRAATPPWPSASSAPAPWCR